MNIHWHEGLFLQPHHLQRFQHAATDALAACRRLNHPYPFGIIEAKVSPDELANFRVRFEKLHIVMPGGIELDFPGNADLPSIDIKPLFANAGAVFTIHLGIPLWQEGRANAGGAPPSPQPDTTSKIIYRVQEEKLADENTGANPQPILTRRLNARLVLDDDDKSDLELLPVLRLVRGTGEQLGQPKIDPEFAPPCLFVTGSAVLHNLVRDLVNQVEASRQELAVQINRGGFDMKTIRGLQIEQLLRLRTLNHFGARLSATLNAANITPFDWYRELRTFHAELAALHPERDDYEIPAYNHENACSSFRQLSMKIRALLRGTVAASFLRVEFTKSAGGLEITLEDQHFTRPIEYFLSVKSAADPHAIAALVEDGNRFKFMPKSLATRAIRGIELKEERFPPMQLPAVAGMSFFRLKRDENARIWDLLKTEKIAVLRGTEFATGDIEAALYMTLPE
ncbi:MAG: type VI secretion system baseplate subunit TssK [Puniceicoccales bacterium]|jgi:type VI secretion system ImpJ/VasE family protein|nr:type VI secretion system baseplate subunit TssK [Puniceicoccales bacterium]